MRKLCRFVGVGMEDAVRCCSKGGKGASEGFRGVKIELTLPGK